MVCFSVKTLFVSGIINIGEEYHKPCTSRTQLPLAFGSDSQHAQTIAVVSHASAPQITPIVQGGTSGNDGLIGATVGLTGWCSLAGYTLDSDSTASILSGEWIVVTLNSDGVLQGQLQVN